MPDDIDDIAWDLSPEDLDALEEYEEETNG